MNRFLLIVFILVPLINFSVPFLSGGEQQFANYGASRVGAAPYAFSIWGIIFAGMIAMSIDLASGNEIDSLPLKRAVKCLIVAGLAAIAFVPISLYSNEFVSWLDIVVHLIVLIMAVRSLRLHANDHPSQRLGRWLFFAPSLYLGWISAATIIATAGMFREAGLTASETMATVIACMTLFFVSLVAIFAVVRRDPFYAATIAWALVAVAVQQADHPAVRWTAVTAAAFLTIFIVLAFCLLPFYARANDAIKHVATC